MGPVSALIVVVKGPEQYLSANRAMHWARRAQLVKAWRTASHVTTLAAMRAHGVTRVDRVTVEIAVHFPDNRRRDAMNVGGPTGKACIDGAVDAGLLVDDDDGHLLGTYVHGFVNRAHTVPALTMFWRGAP